MNNLTMNSDNTVDGRNVRGMRILYLVASYGMH